MDLSDLNVLIIDSDETFLFIAKNTLEHKGATVTTCKNPLFAITVIKTGCFDRIICDTCTSPMGGIELLSNIKHKLADNVRFIITSAKEQFSEQKVAICGANAFIAKPVNFSQLSRSLQESSDPMPLRKCQSY